jgi:hypothetical protein
VFEALFNKQSSSRARRSTTSKAAADEWIGKKVPTQSVRCSRYRARARPVLNGDVFYALANQIYGTIPFLVLFQVGFLYTGLLSIVPAVRRREVVPRVSARPPGLVKSRVAVIRVIPGPSSPTSIRS